MGDQLPGFWSAYKKRAAGDGLIGVRCDRCSAAGRPIGSRWAGSSGDR